jgi:hypothetical protein
MRAKGYVVTVHCNEGKAIEQVTVPDKDTARRVALAFSCLLETPTVDVEATVVVRDALGYEVFSIESDGAPT